MKFVQCLAGLDAEFLAEGATQCPVGRHRVGLPAGPVERQDHQPVDLFVQRIFAPEALKFRDQLAVLAQCQAGFDEPLLRAQQRLVESLRPVVEPLQIGDVDE